MSLCNADVVSPLRLHLRQDSLFRGAKVNTESISRFHEVIREVGGLKAAHEIRQALPSRLNAEMADCLLFGLTTFFDRVEDSLENLTGGGFLTGEDGTVLDIVETAIRRV